MADVVISLYVEDGDTLAKRVYSDSKGTFRAGPLYHERQYRVVCTLRTLLRTVIFSLVMCFVCVRLLGSGERRLPLSTPGQ